jgi:hypothetical protein
MYRANNVVAIALEIIFSPRPCYSFTPLCKSVRVKTQKLYFSIFKSQLLCAGVVLDLYLSSEKALGHIY